MSRYFTGVGSRNTPPEIIDVMVQIGFHLSNRYYTFRSGDADGSDRAFYKGFLQAGGNMEIYLPWNGFNGSFEDDVFINTPKLDNYDKATEILKEVLPYYDNLKDSHRSLHTRNVYQVLGRRLNEPSDLCVYYAEPTGKNGHVKGGTNTAVQLCKLYDVPSFNLWYPNVLEEIKRRIRY